MKYIEASAQVVDLENKDVFTSVTSIPADVQDDINTLLDAFGFENIEELDALLTKPENGWVNGVDGLIKALEDPNINLNIHTMKQEKNLNKRHLQVCNQYDGSDSASAFSADVEDFDDAEW